MSTTTLAEEITSLGLDLDDPNQVYFDSTSLAYWINQAQLDIARRAECLMNYEQMDSLANVAYYAAPQDCIRIHELTFSPNDPMQIYPLTYRGRQEMNNIWYVNQQSPGTYPLFYTTWSQPPLIMVQVYPLPSQAGQLQYWYYRLPVEVVNSSDYIDVPSGWEDCLTSYVRYRV